MDLQQSFFLQKPIVGIRQEVLGRAKRKNHQYWKTNFNFAHLVIDFPNIAGITVNQMVRFLQKMYTFLSNLSENPYQNPYHP